MLKVNSEVKKTIYYAFMKGILNVKNIILFHVLALNRKSLCIFWYLCYIFHHNMKNKCYTQRCFIKTIFFMINFPNKSTFLNNIDFVCYGGKCNINDTVRQSYIPENT